MKIFKFFLVLSIAFLSTPLVYAEPKSIYSIQIISNTVLKNAENVVEHISRITSLPVRLEKIGGYYVVRAGIAEKPADLMSDLNTIINNGYSQAYLREAYYLKERIIIEAKPPIENKAETQRTKEENIHTETEERRKTEMKKLAEAEESRKLKEKLLAQAEAQRKKEEEMLVKKNKYSPKLTKLTHNKKQRLEFAPIPVEMARYDTISSGGKYYLGKAIEIQFKKGHSIHWEDWYETNDQYCKKLYSDRFCVSKSNVKTVKYVGKKQGQAKEIL